MTRIHVLPRLILATAALSSSAWTQTTTRVSVDSSGVQGNAASGESSGYARTSLSADGRFVAFQSNASNLVANDTNAASDVFVRDRLLGTTVRVSVDSSGNEGDAGSVSPSISDDGRYVAFIGFATNLVPADTNASGDIFVHDRQTGTTVVASVDSSGTLGNGRSISPDISADGRFVAFESLATNLAPGDPGTISDVFVHDLQTATTVVVSVNSGGTWGNGNSNVPSISGDGRYVVFQSSASNLDPNNGFFFDIYLRDLQTSTTTIVSVSTAGIANESNCYSPEISDDGRYVVFDSSASNLVLGDNVGSNDVFLRDLQSSTTVYANLTSSGFKVTEAHYGRVSSDGRFVSFYTNLTGDPGDTNGFSDAYVHDRQSGVTARTSLTSGGTAGNADPLFLTPAMSADGSTVAFLSVATNFVTGDTNGVRDVFVRERADNTWAFTRFCFPGENGIVGCPCGNPPSASGRGCNNYGAGPVDSGRLRGSGNSSFAGDTLVLTADGLNNTSLAIFWQGKVPTSATGFAHGAGVRCVSNALKRIYNGNAVAGSISRPGMGHLSVHAQSTAAGDVIFAGQSRNYFVIYRDPMATGPCGSTASGINLTNAGAVSWAP